MAESNQTEIKFPTSGTSNECICSHVLPDIQEELAHMKLEVLKILEKHPEWGGLLYDTLRYGIKGHVIEDQLAKGRCFEQGCMDEVPAMSRHFLCSADIHII